MKHLDSAAHTRGESAYVDDATPPDRLLHAAVFGSPIAHGTLRRLDVEVARRQDGVVAVLTAEDIPGENQIGPIIPDEELLATQQVHFIGQPVAVVYAESPEQARRALASIDCDIDPLPVVTDPRQAYALGEIIDKPRELTLGDVDTAWEGCDVIVEGSCDIGGQEHVYLETQRARALPLEGRQLRVESSTQSPYATQKTIARVLGVALHCIEVDVKRLGGGFGGKEDQASPWAGFAALGAWHTRRPVELVLRRDEDLRMTGKRHPYLADFKMGLAKDGKIVAYEARFFQNSGASADLSTPVLDRTLFHSTNSYFIPHLRVWGVCCRTHLPPNTAFRGFGGPQGMFVIESALDKAAEALKMRREDLQRHNLLVDGDVFPYGQEVLEGRAERTWDEGIDLYDLEGMRRRVEEHNANHIESKKGYALMPICFGISFTATHMNQAGALVHVYTDGSVSVSTGGVEMGQGISTNVATVVARTLGIEDRRVKVETTNTTRIANMSASAASSTSLLNGNAALLACQSILRRLKDLAAEKLELPDSDRVTLVDEQVLVDGETTDWTWQRLVQEAYLSRVALSAHEHFATPNIWFDPKEGKGRPFAYHVFGTALTEVTVDVLRGTYDIDRVKILHDLGRPLNATVDLGQVEGGLAQGLGWMTLEDLRYAADGRLMSHALATYKVPDVYFMPDDLEVRFLENAGNPLGPFHNKAVGEPPLMYGIGVFFALRHALKAYRGDAELPFDAPLTPERVMLQLHGERLAAILPDAILPDSSEQTTAVETPALVP